MPISYKLFPFVFWVSLSITVLFRQYLWVLSYPISYNHSLIRVFDKPLFPLPENGSDQNIFIHNIQISFAAHIQNKSKTADLSHLTQIGLIGTLEKGSLTKIFPSFILRDAQIVISSTRPTGAQRVTYPLSRRLRSLADSFALNLLASLPSTEADLAAGILLGGNQRFSYQFRENIRQAGLLHLTAVSGYNITVLIASAIVLFKLLGKHYLVIPGVILSIIFFTLITGGGASVIRAALMGAIGFLALQAGSIRSTQRIFVLVALLMLILKPSWLWDVGWELSTAATASLIWIAPVVSFRLSVISSWFIRFLFVGSKLANRQPINYNPITENRKPITGTLIESLSASLSAYLATFPILVWRFSWNNISWVGIFTNLFTQPLIPPIMAIAAAIGFTGMIWPSGAEFLGIIGRPPIWALVKIIELGAKVNQLLN